MRFDLRKLIGIPIGSFILMFGLAACIFTATDYERAPQVPNMPQMPSQPQTQYRLFNQYTYRNTVQEPDGQFIFWNQSGGAGGSSQTISLTGVQVHMALVGNNLNGIHQFRNNLERLIPTTAAFPVAVNELRNHVFVGRYGGLEYTELINYNGEIAFLRTGPTNSDNTLRNRLSGVLENENLMRNRNLYFVIFHLGYMNNPEWMQTGLQRPISVSRDQLRNILQWNSIITTNGVSSSSRVLTIRISSSQNPPMLVNERPDVGTPNIPDDNDPTPPTTPEVPGDNGSGDYDPSVDNGSGEGETGSSSDNQVIIPALRDSWWTQFREWLRRQIFVNP